MKTAQLRENLPVVKNIKTICDMSEIAFEWSPLGDFNEVSGYYLYRKGKNEPEFKLVGKIKDRFSSHYVDENLEPNTTYSYTMRTYDKTGNYSKNGAVISATTQHRIDSVPFAQISRNLPQRIKIIWRPHPDLRVRSYIIERTEMNVENWREIAEIKGRLNAEYIDFGLDSGKSYKYRISVKTFSGVASKTSEIFGASTKQLPKAVANLKATNTEPKKIIVSWDSSNSKDFSHYNVYATTNFLLPYRLIGSPNVNKFSDIINENGVTKYYKVTAVDTSGLESLRQDDAVAGNTLGAPQSPVFTNATYKNGAVMLSWNSRDSRVTSFMLKKTGNGSESIFEVKGTSYIDSEVSSGVEYTYKIVGFDKFGISSDESDKAVIMVQ